VERPGLTHYLAGTAVKLVLVAAPAGFGKTTLAAQWRSSTAESRLFAWVSLDRGDDDPSRLWWYVVSALRRACPEFGGEDILRELRVQAPDITGAVLPMLANKLAALSAPVVLVLDDYHVIKERSCHDQLGFLLLHLPPSAELVLITRADPPLPLGHLRAAGEMVEVRARELRFAPAEAATLVHAVSGVQLSDPDLADLTDRAEGWPAGLHLAALSLRGQSSPGAFVRQFTGDNRFIVDFLAEEVLSHQPPEIQRFLARTSILGRFCAALCEAVTGVTNAAEIIEVLERENLFLVPLDDNRQWYRYHHLFAQVLRRLLARTEPDNIPALHERASAWHRGSGSTEEAVSHALATGDVAGVIDLIARDWYGYVDLGRTATVRSWLRSLGDDRIAASPVAAHCAAWTAALSGDRESLGRWLPVIETAAPDGPLPDGMQSLKSSAALLRAVFGFDGLRVMRKSAATASELEHDPASPFYALARGALGFSLYLSGETTAAAGPLNEAIQSETPVSLIRLLSLSVLSMVAVELGSLSQAEELAHAARLLAVRGDLSKAPQSSLAHAAAGAVYAARGQLGEARNELELSLRNRRKVPGLSPWPTIASVLLLAEVSLSLGDQPRSAELAGEVRDVLSAFPDGTEALRARLARLERRITARSGGPQLTEPLTRSEVAVLRLLQGTLSLAEIGRELSLSKNTIKTHTQAIYRKLGASTRRDAVERAGRQGLL
jgi:ATP/maltotriose-dependent transcriptional regulator MalT